jgi:protein-S-isoprenylcysteine O-methyltransferase Ste14
LAAGNFRDIVPFPLKLPAAEGGEVGFSGRLGIGPWVGGPAFVYLLLAGYPCWHWYEYVRVPAPWRWAAVPGAVLLVVGLWLYCWSLRALMKAWKSGALAKTGPYALVRHPAYAAWVLLILPGGVLLSGVWPLFLAPVLALHGFCRHIGHEEARDRARFGEEYARYCRDVPGRLVPRRGGG